MSKESDYWNDVPDEVEFDIFCKPGEPWGRKNTLEIHSRKKGYLASVIDDEGVSMEMQATSVIDHITEPRTVTEYSVEPSTTTTQWLLMRKFAPSYEAVLGACTEEAGAQRLLEYLKSNDV